MTKMGASRIASTTLVPDARSSHPPTARFAIIDGLRGVAALLVAFVHLSEAAKIASVPVLGYVMQHGGLGVEIFFVISGFVIAYSVRNGDHTVSFLGRFALRRSIRLDPAYWVTIACEIALVKLSLMLIPTHKVALPSVTDVLAHMAYAQEFLDRKSVV